MLKESRDKHKKLHAQICIIFTSDGSCTCFARAYLFVHCSRSNDQIGVHICALKLPSNRKNIFIQERELTNSFGYRKKLIP